MQFSKEEILERKLCAEQKIRKTCPEYVRENEVSSNSIIFSNKLSHINTTHENGLEFLLWDTLQNEKYWQSIDYLKLLLDKGVQYSEQDLQRLTRTTVQQAFEGKSVASSVPLYSDAWNRIGSEDSPLKHYVTDEDKKTAVNNGFWHCLNSCSETSKIQDNAKRELSNIMTYLDFFKHFDFVEGVQESQKLPEDLSLRGTGESYLTWLLVQQHELYNRSDREKADETFGKLVAPMVYELLLDTDYRGNIKRAIATHIINEDVIQTPAMQKCLERVFDIELRMAFEGDIGYSLRTIEMCKSHLTNTKERAIKLWEELNDYKKDIGTIDPTVEEYIPTKAYEDYIEETKQSLTSMKRFNIDLFKQWMSSTIFNRVSPSHHGTVRNNALKVYKNQKQRPSRKDIVSLSSFSLDDKTKGYVFLDLTLRREWRGANKLLRNYWCPFYTTSFLTTPKKRREFRTGITEYVGVHGDIKIDEEGLDSNVCYPDYNLLKDFAEKPPECFR